MDMTDPSECDTPKRSGTVPRLPRLALMGEFSAGKSTLSNLLLGGQALPTRVTATRLPPVWINWGEGAGAVDHNGVETPLDLDAIEAVDLDETRLIRLGLKADFLQICDLIDMPGISDPNMDPSVWKSVVDQADCVVWCTHATQAWRQSEAAVWQELRGGTLGHDFLLVTQIDKLSNERDRRRVLARLRRETEGQFESVHTISLLDAIRAGDDEAKWIASGASEFTSILVETLLSFDLLIAETAQTDPDTDTDAETADFDGTDQNVFAAPDSADPNAPVRPKRVQAREGAKRERPEKSSQPLILLPEDDGASRPESQGVI